MSEISNGALALRINDMVGRWDVREKQHRDWLAGTADGGPYGDGRYPLSSSSGTVYYIKCPAALQAEVDGPASTVGAQAAAAESAATAANASATAAATSANQATTQKNQAVTARESAELAKLNAESAEANALTHRTAAEAAAASAVTDSAELAQVVLDVDADRVAAETAAANAAASAAAAATFDPASFYNKTTSDSRYRLQSVAITYAELSGKPATFAPSAHGHTKAEVGLGNVDNTSDAAKPVSTAQAAAIAAKQDSATAWNTGNFNPANKLDVAFMSKHAIPDTRTSAPQPNQYGGQSAQWDFKNFADTGATGGDQWHAIMTVSPWVDFNPEHRQQQLTFTGTGGIKFRYATGPTTWSPHRTVAFAEAPEFKEKATVEMAVFIKNTSAAWTPPAGKVFGHYYNDALSPGAVQFAYDYTNGGYQPLQVQASEWSLAFDGVVKSVTAYPGNFNFVGSIQASGPSAELVFFDRSTSRRWLWYANGDVAHLWNGGANVVSVNVNGGMSASSFSPTNGNNAYIDGNGSGLHLAGNKYFAGGDMWQLWANSGGWQRMPRTFVGGTDPGAAAGTDDVWIT